MPKGEIICESCGHYEGECLCRLPMREIARLILSDYWKYKGGENVSNLSNSTLFFEVDALDLIAYVYKRFGGKE